MGNERYIDEYNSLTKFGNFAAFVKTSMNYKPSSLIFLRTVGRISNEAIADGERTVVYPGKSRATWSYNIF